MLHAGGRIHIHVPPTANRAPYLLTTIILVSYLHAQGSEEQDRKASEGGAQAGSSTALGKLARTSDRVANAGFNLFELLRGRRRDGCAGTGDGGGAVVSAKCRQCAASRARTSELVVRCDCYTLGSDLILCARSRSSDVLLRGTGAIGGGVQRQLERVGEGGAEADEEKSAAHR